MSRIASRPVVVPAGVTVNVTTDTVSVKGPKGELKQAMHTLIGITEQEGKLFFKAKNKTKLSRALSGTYRALLANMVQGVSNGFEKRLTLVGVGYRAKVQGRALNLTLGFSHPIDHELPEGIMAECPSQTEIVLKGIDKQLVGQVAADIRGYRPPEPYKGKGVRYANEQIVLKEAKKK